MEPATAAARIGDALPRLRILAGRDKAALAFLPLLEAGPLRLKVLGARVCLDPSTVSRHVAALVDQGLVSRAPDAADRRASVVELTRAGRTALADARTRRNQRIEAALGGWDPSDLELFTEHFRRFTDHLENT